MIRIVVPREADRILPFYLAAEEWVAGHLPAAEYFFAWQVSPSIICGRHQIMPLEVDMDYCRANNINVWRRKSGGGCVYADLHNVMFSYITPSHSVQTTFGRYTAMICRMLGDLGIEAKSTGRNDVEIGGMKVAGNAFYSLPSRSIVHGTMLYDADFATMQRALTPSRAKLLSKGVKSVPSRVTTLRGQGLQLTCDEFVDYALDALCDEGSYELTPEDIAQVNEIMESYLRPEFLRADERYEPTRRVRLEGVGEIACTLDGDGCIGNVDLSGDYFPIGDVARELTPLLRGVKADREALAEVLRGTDVSRVIAGLTNDKLIEILTR